MIPSVESIHNAIDALGTSGAWKSVGLIGMVTAVRERVDNVKTSGPITVALAGTLIAGAFTLGGIAWMIAGQDKKIDTLVSGVDSSLSTQRLEMTARIDAIMESANANTALLAESFKNQLDLSHQLWKSELAQRDIKLGIAYDSANQGPRYTAAMAADHDKEDQARAELCDARYYETKQAISELQHNCKDTMKKVEEIESQHSGVGFHPGGKGK